ncbi:hypothetical protein [Paenibacillus stellifer]|uniref:hypothetical protein n=1 Tax=Paenibacillus stellifer TaxID=169760 RepID=UPI0014703A97|nr:hypothetical protein [Paenibacillus stellifer]
MGHISYVFNNVNYYITGGLGRSRLTVTFLEKDAGGTDEQPKSKERRLAGKPLDERSSDHCTG